MDILISNIKGLVVMDQPSGQALSGHKMDELTLLEDAYLALDQGKIHSYGLMADQPGISSSLNIDAGGRFVLPSFVDSHSHIVYAGSREQEFVDKIRGLSYSEIAAKGGGILNSAALLQDTSEDQLLVQAMARTQEIILTGTGALEIKSGYGLTVKDELKMLRVARKLKDYTPLTIKTTFLGAHAIPQNTQREHYIDQIVKEMIPAVAEEKLADYCDVFCEQGFFTPEESTTILLEGLKYGLKPKVHANQLHRSGGVQVGVDVGAISVDHLECVADEEIQYLKKSDTLATLLPGAAFFLNLPYPPARDMLKAELPLSLASDYNPGSAPSGNMGLIWSLACIKMRMTPAEALNAATYNGACAIELQDQLGSITAGKIANVMITSPIPSIAYLPYSYGTNLIETVILNGEVVNQGPLK